MFCTKCGREIKDGVRFCPGCGAPTKAASSVTEAPPLRHSMREQSAPNSRRPQGGSESGAPKALWYALGGVGAAAVVIAAAVFGYRAFHKDAGSTEAASENEDSLIATEAEQPLVADGADAAYGEDGGQTAEADAQNLRREALRAKEQELLAQYGVLKSPQGIKVWSDAEDGHEGRLNLAGLWSTTVLDLDADGLDEMLVCAAEGNTPMLYLYDGEEAGEVAQTGAVLLTPHAEGIPQEQYEMHYSGTCDELLAVHVMNLGEKPKIVCEFRERTGYFAEGYTSEDYWIMEYAKQELRYTGVLRCYREGLWSDVTRYEFQDGVYTGEVCYYRDYLQTDEWDDEIGGYEERTVREGEYADADTARAAFLDSYQIRTNSEKYDISWGEALVSVLSSENDMTLCFELTTRATDSWNGDYTYSYTYGHTFETVCRTENEWSNQAAADTGAAADTDYILPDSNTRYLTREDLAGLSAEECRIARNEIYARHGRRFKDEALQSYFDGKDWYAGTTDEVTDDMLNAYELANRDLIIAYEEEQGYR